MVSIIFQDFSIMESREFYTIIVQKIFIQDSDHHSISNDHFQDHSITTSSKYIIIFQDPNSKGKEGAILKTRFV